MPIFEDYSKNGELLQVRVEPLNEANFARYVRVEGKEKASGYLDGFEKILLRVQGCVECQLDDLSWIDNSPHAARKKSKKLYDELLELIKFAKIKINNVEYDDTKLVKLNSPSDDFTSNKDLASTSSELLNINSLSSYVELSGVEKTKGYIDASEDMLELIDGCIDTNDGSNIFENSPTIILRKMQEMYAERLDFLEVAKTQIKNPNLISMPVERPKLKLY